MLTIKISFLPLFEFVSFRPTWIIFVQFAEHTEFNHPEKSSGKDSFLQLHFREVH